MSSKHATLTTALRCGLGVAGSPWAGSMAGVGSHADGGFGLVVVDPGNPRRARGIANVLFAVTF